MTVKSGEVCEVCELLATDLVNVLSKDATKVYILDI